MFDGILFDLDGTLWDAVPEITRCWNQVIAAAGVAQPPLTVEGMRPCMGMLMDDIAARCLPGLSRERRTQVIEACFTQENAYLARHGAAVYPGAGETLKSLAARCPLFVVSNCQDGYIQAFLQSTGLGRYFTGFECAGRTGKPKSENIAGMVAKYGLKNPVYVGDTILDCTSAREAGVPFVHAAYGFGTVEDAPRVTAFDQLPGVLEALSPT